VWYSDYSEKKKEGEMLIQEQWVNKTEGYRCGDSGLYEPFTDDIRRLFRSLQREYGRCIGKVRIDPDGKVIGWVFEKRVKYEDVNETYLLETWVSLHDDNPERTVKYKYHYLN